MAIELTRLSTGLSPAHVALIKLLAEIAVEDYLREVQAGTENTNGDPQVEDLTR